MLLLLLPLLLAQDSLGHLSSHHESPGHESGDHESGYHESGSHESSDQLSVAAIFSSGMVLQEAPAAARIFG